MPTARDMLAVVARSIAMIIAHAIVLAFHLIYFDPQGQLGAWPQDDNGR
jgi:hypothetical protein